MNYAEYYMSLKFRILQIISLITLMILSKNHSNIVKMTLILQIQKVKVFIRA